jgi:excisionase family DNA binding protein
MEQLVSSLTEKELTTTQAARLVGVSRQYVVELCNRGEVPHRRVGSHRRIRREDIVRYFAPAHSPLSRKDRVSLAIHCLVAQRWLCDEDNIRAHALKNIDTMRRANSDGTASVYLTAWSHLLDGPFEPLLATLTSLDESARDLRNVTPFAGVVPDEQRRELLRSVR